MPIDLAAMTGEEIREIWARHCATGGWSYAAVYCAMREASLTEAERLRGSLISELESRDAEIAKLRADTDRLDFMERNPRLEIAYGDSTEPGSDGEGSWFVYRIDGGVNDREWTQIAEADTQREAIDRARAALSTAENEI